MIGDLAASGGGWRLPCFACHNERASFAMTVIARKNYEAI